MSHKLDLDFVTRQPFALQQVNSLGLVFLLGGLLLAGLVALHYQTQLSALQQAQAALTQAQPKTAQAQATASPVADEELQQARAVADELMLPWPSLLNALEQVEQQHIALLGITPNKKKRQLQLTGQAKNMQSALYYIEQLEASSMLSQVYLQKHDVDINDAFQPVNFTIMASW
ncbi:MAG TPA: PilN domain-containing protein [Methylophilus sp.]